MNLCTIGLTVKDPCLFSAQYVRYPCRDFYVKKEYTVNWERTIGTVREEKHSCNYRRLFKIFLFLNIIWSNLYSNFFSVVDPEDP